MSYATFIIRVPILVGLLAAPALADVAGQDGKVLGCYRTDSRGDRVNPGETICLEVDGRMFMAQCQMSLNLPIWREVSTGCLSSQLRQPAFDAVPIDAHVPSAEP